MLYSIIIPIYNVEKYLRTCVESVVCQTYQNIQIILVDDGSLDGCPGICDEYGNKDSRIIVIHKENGGLSEARNYGIESAKGDYIIFLDSDDAILPDAVENLDACLVDRVDVLIVEEVSTEDVESYNDHEILFEIPAIKERAEYVQYILYEKPNTWAAPLFIVRRGLIEEHSLQFDAGYFHEDIAWTARLLAAAQTYKCFNYSWYICRKNRDGSITSTITPKRFIDLLTLVERELRSPLYDTLPKSEKQMLFERLSDTALSSMRYAYGYSDQDINEMSRLIDDSPQVKRYVTRVKYKLFFFISRIIGTKKAVRLVGRLYHDIGK